MTMSRTYTDEDGVAVTLSDINAAASARIAELEALLGEKTRRVAELETAVRQWEVIHAALGTNEKSPQ